MELRQSINDSGGPRVVVYIHRHGGPWGSTPLPDGLGLSDAIEVHLRELQWAAPGVQGVEYTIFMVLIAMGGHPIVFRLTNFMEKLRGPILSWTNFADLFHLPILWANVPHS